ncbi:hypothetical protein HOY82DRAFT_652428 [Tuber indicum]|nr:hypothetical protein HOY82DRAFT_652428 [Tuber indicum]
MVLHDERAEDPDAVPVEHVPDVVLLNQKERIEVEIIYRHDLEYVRKALGPDHPITLDTMNMLGETLLVLEKYEQAEVVCR